MLPNRDGELRINDIVKYKERSKKMKGSYEKAEMEVIRFESEDIITSSGEQGETPEVPLP